MSAGQITKKEPSNRAPRRADPPRMVWPVAVPLLIWWEADYADLRERIRRTGRLDREATGEERDPGMATFRTRAGFPGYVNKWRTEEERERAEEEARKHPGRLSQAEWLEQQRRRYLKQWRSVI